MAKLSAHGTEIKRVSHGWISSPDSSVQTREEFSFRSDGHILRKVTFKGGCFSTPEGSWKLWKRFPPAVRSDRVRLEAGVAKIASIWEERLSF